MMNNKAWSFEEQLRRIVSDMNVAFTEFMDKGGHIELTIDDANRLMEFRIKFSNLKKYVGVKN